MSNISLEIKKQNRPWEWAAQKGRLDVIEWLHANKHKKNSTHIMSTAAKKGRLDVIEWLHANKKHKKNSTHIMDTAAKYGHLDVVKWLHANGYGYVWAMDWAAAGGHLHVVKWLHINIPEIKCTNCAIEWALLMNYSSKIVKILKKHEM